MKNTIKTFTLALRKTVNISKHTRLKTSEMQNDIKIKHNQGKES